MWLVIHLWINKCHCIWSYLSTFTSTTKPDDFVSKISVVIRINQRISEWTCMIGKIDQPINEKHDTKWSFVKNTVGSEHCHNNIGTKRQHISNNGYCKHSYCFGFWPGLYFVHHSILASAIKEDGYFRVKPKDDGQWNKKCKNKIKCGGGSTQRVLRDITKLLMSTIVASHFSSFGDL